MASDAMTEIELECPSEISPNWNKGHHPMAELGDLLSLMTVLNESQCLDDETTCDKVVAVHQARPNHMVWIARS